MKLLPLVKPLVPKLIRESVRLTLEPVPEYTVAPTPAQFRLKLVLVATAVEPENAKSADPRLPAVQSSMLPLVTFAHMARVGGARVSRCFLSWRWSREHMLSLTLTLTSHPHPHPHFHPHPHPQPSPHPYPHPHLDVPAVDRSEAATTALRYN